MRRGKFDARQGAGDTHVRLKGELKQNGKASGTLSYDLVSMSFGGCSTGKLDWVAQK